MVLKSFYDLRFGVSALGARQDVHYICGSLDEAKAVLVSEFASFVKAGMLFYSADVALDVYQRGERVRSIDLHPFVTIRVDGYPDITFLGPGEPTGYAVGADDPHKVRTELADGMVAGDFDDAIEVTVDWGSACVPPLVGEIAKDGDCVMLGDGPPDDDLDDLDDLDEEELEDELLGRGYVGYGFHDFDG
ncbi:hypothetical protein [Streptomyces sp. NPDC053427]|uniref:hypothetical protein n=1 Tax=Streptomyces sp. NPDC053427 TaxID=3365701 RepID=UPI0037D7532C